MTMLRETATGQDHSVEHTIQQLRELYADAPEMAKVALEHALPALKSQALEAQAIADRKRRADRHPSGLGL